MITAHQQNFETIQALCAAYVDERKAINIAHADIDEKISVLHEKIRQLEVLRNHINNQGKFESWLDMIKPIIDALKTQAPDYNFESCYPCGLDAEVYIKTWPKSADEHDNEISLVSKEITLVPCFTYNDSPHFLKAFEFKIKMNDVPDGIPIKNGTLRASNRIDRKKVPLPGNTTLNGLFSMLINSDTNHGIPT